MEKSDFIITNKDSGEDLELTLIGFTNVEHKVYAVCKLLESSDIVILRIRQDAKTKERYFTLVEDKKYCKLVYDNYIKSISD